MTYRTERMLEELKARRMRERRLALGEQAEQNATAKEGSVIAITEYLIRETFEDADKSE